MSCVTVLWLMGKAQQWGAERDQRTSFGLAGVGEGRGIAARCPWLLWEAGAGEESGTAVQCSVVRMTA